MRRRRCTSVTGLFDDVYILDFSARSTPSPRRETADALWLGHAAAAPRPRPQARYFRTRSAVADHLADALPPRLDAGRRVLLGVDFGLGYPAGFADAAGLPGAGPPWRRTWDFLADAVDDAPDNANNRFAVAAELNARLAATESHDPARGACPRFWACPPQHTGPHLTARRPAWPPCDRPDHPDRPVRVARRRRVERVVASTHELWKLYTAGSVGGQTLLGIAWLHRLLARPGLAGRAAVWPFEPPGPHALVVAEVYPRLNDDDPAAAHHAHPVRDAAQVLTLAATAAATAAGTRADRLAGPDGLPEADRTAVRSEEGWIFGVPAGAGG